MKVTSSFSILVVVLVGVHPVAAEQCPIVLSRPAPQWQVECKAIDNIPNCSIGLPQDICTAENYQAYEENLITFEALTWLEDNDYCALTDYGIILVICHEEADSDGDGIGDASDVCPETLLPEGAVPSIRLGVNRWADIDGDGVFDTKTPPGGGNGPRRTFTVEDTYGCSCEQIINTLQLGSGHSKFGCSIGAMEDWVSSVQHEDSSGCSAGGHGNVFLGFLLFFGLQWIRRYDCAA